MAESCTLQDMWLSDEIVGMLHGLDPAVHCKCKNTCSRKLGARGGCPCRSAGKECVPGFGGCKCGTPKVPCRNRKEISNNVPADAGQSSSDDYSSDSSDSEEMDEISEVHGLQLPDHGLQLPEPVEGQPAFCVCGKCQPMPTHIENKCCLKRDCITMERQFFKYCQDTDILQLVMRMRGASFYEDFLELTNENYRFSAYFAFTSWQHGYLGKGNRLVIPACCVRKIRETFPSSDGNYAGFLPGRYPS